MWRCVSVGILVDDSIVVLETLPAPSARQTPFHLRSWPGRDRLARSRSRWSTSWCTAHGRDDEPCRQFFLSHCRGDHRATLSSCSCPHVTPMLARQFLRSAESH